MKEIYSSILGINLKYLFPLFQWHACKLAKRSACIANFMTTVNKIYIFKFFTGVSYFAAGRFPKFIARVDEVFVQARQRLWVYMNCFSRFLNWDPLHEEHLLLRLTNNRHPMCCELVFLLCAVHLSFLSTQHS